MNSVFTDIAGMYVNQRNALTTPERNKAKQNLKIMNYPRNEMLYFQRDLGCFY